MGGFGRRVRANCVGVGVGSHNPKKIKRQFFQYNLYKGPINLRMGPSRLYVDSARFGRSPRGIPWKPWGTNLILFWSQKPIFRNVSWILEELDNFSREKQVPPDILLQMYKF